MSAAVAHLAVAGLLGQSGLLWDTLYTLADSRMCMSICVCGVQVCELAAATEASSEHPLARAVLEFSEARLASPEPTDKHIVAWTFDFRNGSSSCSSSSATGNHVHAHMHAHAPCTPPKEQLRSFTATFSLDDDHSGSSTPAQWHAHHPAGNSSRSHSPTKLGSGGGSIQLVDVPLISPRATDSSAAFCYPRHSAGVAAPAAVVSSYNSGHGKHWSAAAGGGYYRRSSAPNSPKVNSSAQQHEHHNGLVVHAGDSELGRVSHGGGAPSTPGRLRHLLSNGLLRVSEVEVSRPQCNAAACCTVSAVGHATCTRLFAHCHLQSILWRWHPGIIGSVQHT